MYQKPSLQFLVSVMLIKVFKISWQPCTSSYLLNYFKLVYHYQPKFNVSKSKLNPSLHFKTGPLLLILIFLSSYHIFLVTRYSTGWQAVWYLGKIIKMQFYSYLLIHIYVNTIQRTNTNYNKCYTHKIIFNVEVATNT